ncbi:major facilitator superfamily domain-containing protein [Exophiala viscosa]|uniref:major facilitator superfamily domain-containing protein n=1 Tax=Exophiala viscosa TaxID=2486360 RepID=UPI002191384D|nr:major facilitator superfamily domain-containing protein [Exophiala viscosa]
MATSTTNDEKIASSTPHHYEQDIMQDEPKIRSEDIQDGDLALKILHTHYEPFTPAEEKRLLRKIDFRLAVLMLFVNGIQFVDKLTISQAATYGLVKEAHLKGQEFSLLISIFYIGYLVAQYPTNVLMQRFPTGKYITVNFVLWGVVLTCMGSCTRFGPFMAARFFLGVFESCLNPGFILITSSWWKREEQPARIAIWYCANGVISIPAGFIFYGVAHMNARGLFPYQWMFIFFGIFTVIFGCCMWWLLPDSPVSARWLNERERLIAVERLKSNKTGVKNTHHKWPQVKEALLDPKVWMLVAGVFVHNMTNSLQTNFTGLIIKGFGYSTYQAVLLSIPSAAIFAVTVLTVSTFLSSKYGEGKRIFAIILCYLPGVISCAILHASPLNSHTKGLHLFAVFFIGCVAASAGIMYSLLASNVAGYTKKTVSGALFFTAYCVANIVSPQTFIATQAPHYTTGIAVSLAAFCVNIVLFSVLYVVYTSANKRRDQMQEGQVSQDETRDLLDAFSDLTDLENKKMRYKL